MENVKWEIDRGDGKCKFICISEKKVVTLRGKRAQRLNSRRQNTRRQNAQEEGIRIKRNEDIG